MKRAISCVSGIPVIWVGKTVGVISIDCLVCLINAPSLLLRLSLQWTCPSLRLRHSSSISTHFVCGSLIHSIPVKVTPMCCKLKLSALLLRGTLYPWRLVLLSFPLATELFYGPRTKDYSRHHFTISVMIAFPALTCMLASSAYLIHSYSVRVKKNKKKSLKLVMWRKRLQKEILHFNCNQRSSLKSALFSCVHAGRKNVRSDAARLIIQS